MRRTLKRLLLVALAVFIAGLLLPERAIVPVQDAGAKDWNGQSFWYEPWGVSGVHKGIDIFAPEGRAVLAPVSGLVVFRGQLGIGGNVVVVLGPKWRLHYFAHLRASQAGALSFVSRGQRIGEVGTSGNAAGKPPHLHYAIVSLFPRPWRFSMATQGWKRMFFVNPDAVLTEGRAR
jgi:murein DD-endopeptidase MepM/ murein hydrolase activator NlpD